MNGRPRAAALAGLLTAVAVMAGCSSGGGTKPLNAAASSATTSTTTANAIAAQTPATTSAPQTTTTTPPTTAPRPTTTTTRPPPPPPVPASANGQAPAGLSSGASGPGVSQLQQNLIALGYWLGTADGKYGYTTSQAVMALQKAAGLPRNGTFNEATAAALTAGTRPATQSTSGHVLEIDLAHQLLMIVNDGKPDIIFNTSTGGGYVYYDHGAKQIAKTPVGHFTTTWAFDGTRVSSLGTLWRPKYFVGGYAIHGSPSVPGYPASHGCVRLSNAAMNWIWASGTDPIGTAVWVY